MKLRRLELSGFKSFPEKTSIDFCDGVTSIVGPNGSGKSNIIEAVRWVMGEQRTKILRCRKMEDLIFNGSDLLKPSGMAEVRLTLDNDGKSFPPPMMDYDEIMVTRRVFRDGSSEYEINGVSCRLSDVVDFFTDSGIGRNSYAIIEQGRVEQIIVAKPEERRIFLEEAASINRYKARRESALKKLEQTNDNLQRIRDVISEVKKQSASLKKQATKAQQYKELKNSLRDFEINIDLVKNPAGFAGVLKKLT
ncbi:MAG: chromosome segregation SMC family protein, partial [Desulfomonilaceae bacterium]